MKLEKRFCVISPIAMNRTYSETAGGSIEHAKDLMRKKLGHERMLYVVEVVAVVRPREEFEVLTVDVPD